MDGFILPERLEKLLLDQDHSPVGKVVIKNSGDKELLFTLRSVEPDKIPPLHLMRRLRSAMLVLICFFQTQNENDQHDRDGYPD